MSLVTKQTRLGARSTSSRTVVCSAAPKPSVNWGQAAAAAAAAFTLLSGPAAMAEFRLPPISKDPNRCARGYVGNTIGQANAVSDKVLDLRLCDFTGKNLSGKVLAGALLGDTNLTDANLQEAVLTKSYAVGAIMENADLTNATIDRVDFTNANLKNTKFINAVITGTVFENANLEGADFEDVVIGNEDVKRICANKTLTGDSRLQVGCRQ